jgi:hypothetical protein
MTQTIREAVGVFDEEKALDAAVYDLETRGFDRAAFSLLATENAVEKKLGHRYREVREMEDEPGAPRETFFSRVSRLESEYLPAPILAAIGALALAGVGPGLTVVVAAGAGAALGGALGRLIHEHHAARVGEQLARGGLVLWVNLRNAHEEETAIEVLHASHAHDVHVHELKG